MNEVQGLLKIIVPSCLVIGAGIELFMIKTGFYDIVTNKQAQRDRDAEIDRIRRRKRLAELNLLPNDDSKTS